MTARFNKKEDELKKYTYCVYVYTDGIAAYIGLTRNYRIKIREKIEVECIYKIMNHMRI